ncbi:baseplate hub protein [Ereboglobus luteus]|uniref:Phage protein Gp138 N-terminal domain-containing protein n=1 Tax=Ereboglobus luteus TaxID=1796921 RepID=A0A2U8E627_9BACT|nr:Gp138 family membrane-puncturing spike protein [Ereboglobus luteus]AWI10317.1 hypothetical protein CKA38_14585 [Ereboglobus luteus]
MRKFEKTFELRLAPRSSWGDEENTIVIKPPLMIDFEVKKDGKPSANTGDFTIYNLGESTRKRIHELKEKSREEEEAGIEKWARVQLSIGYGGNNILVFDGDIKATRDSHEKNNTKTIIEAGEGLYAIAWSYSVHDFEPDASMDSLIKTLAADLSLMPDLAHTPEAGAPYIGKFGGQVSTDDGLFSRKLVVFGNTWEQLKKYTNQRCFIDKERLYVIPQKSWNTTKDLSFKISHENGLIGTPQRKGDSVVVNMLFEPQLMVGALAKLDSRTLPGEYVIDAIAHKHNVVKNEESLTTVTLVKKNKFNKETQGGTGSTGQDTSKKDAQDALKNNATDTTSLDLTSLLDLSKRNMFVDLNCHKLGTIVSFDNEDQTASVDINHNGVYGNKPIKYPILKKVPIFVLSGGKASLTMPVAVGDTCLLLFSDRNIDTWFETGEADAIPASPRTHHISDALAIVGFRPKSKKISDYNTSDVELRNNKALIATCQDGLIRMQSETESLHGLLSNVIKCIEGLVVDTKSGKRITPTDDDLTQIKSQLNALLK